MGAATPFRHTVDDGDITISGIPLSHLYSPTYSELNINREAPRKECHDPGSRIAQ